MAASGRFRPLTLGPPLRLQIAGRSFGVCLGIKGPLLQLSNTPTGGLTLFHFLPGYRDARDFVNFPRGLVGRGYSDEAVRGILG